jgi:hypothetical protein
MSPTRKIAALTEEQQERFDEFVERWTAIGLCTDPADRPRAEAAIREIYRQGGLPPPRAIVWCGSPLSLGRIGAIIRDRSLFAEVPSGAGSSVANRVRWRVHQDVHGSVAAAVQTEPMRADECGGFTAFDWHIADAWQRVRMNVGSKVRASVDGVQRSVWAGVWDGVRTSVRDSVDHSFLLDGIWWSNKTKRDPDSYELRMWSRRDTSTVLQTMEESTGDAFVHGAHEAAWLAFYRYFHDVVGLIDETSKLSGLWELAQSAGWAAPYRNMCWVSERHCILARDEEGRLHSLAGPACAWPDGFAIYAVHGIRVPQYVIERPRQISIERIDGEQNAEVRRVMIERYRHGEKLSGAAAFIRDAGGERLDHDERYGTLWRRSIPDDEPIVMIEVVNSTREPDGRFKRYWLRVPPDMTTAREAVAWTFNVPAEDYAPVKET